MSQPTSPNVESFDQVLNVPEEPPSNSSEDWLDEMCLEPLVAPESGFSKLCNACKRVFSVHPGNERANHIKTLDTLVRSAPRGCVLCVILLHRIEGTFTDHRPPHQLNLRYEVGYGNGYPKNLGVTLTGDGIYVDLRMLPSGAHLDFFPCEHTLRFIILGTHSQYLSSHHQVVPSTSSLENQSLARKWVHQCLSSHDPCNASVRSLPNIPTRLIEIIGSDAQPLLRLVETASHPREGNYMTLSHCWGDADFLTLRERCLNDMKEDITWSSLPKTFQDAVIVTMWFKIKYLWIDSLCIIQDSRQDWERESILMNHIYKNSFLTIAATKAIDATGGLFVNRNADVVRVSRVRAPWSQQPEDDCLLFDHRLWELEVVGSPLLKRAWVCQERLLSPRMLHFGQSQMFWECQELGACEMFPETFPLEADPTELEARKGLLIFKNEYSLHLNWRSIVTMYSRGNLTKVSDKCIAFAGIVEEAQAFARDQYLAGFWRTDIEKQLLWEIEHVTPVGRPLPSMAPSWSWLSINGGQVQSAYGFPGEEKVLLEILDVRTTHSSDNTLGPIESGYIHARGILGPVVLEHKYDHSWREFREIRGRRPPQTCGAFMDELVDKAGSDAAYLPILGLEKAYIVKGLLLTPTEAETEYRRIGMFELSGEGLYRLLMETEIQKGVWTRLPSRTFTLV